MKNPSTILLMLSCLVVGPLSGGEIHRVDGKTIEKSLVVEGAALSKESDVRPVVSEFYSEMYTKHFGPMGSLDGRQELGLVSLAFDIEKFAIKGETVWESRMLDQSGRIMMMVLVHPASSKIHLLVGPEVPSSQPPK